VNKNNVQTDKVVKCYWNHCKTIGKWLLNQEFSDEAWSYQYNLSKQSQFKKKDPYKELFGDTTHTRPLDSQEMDFFWSNALNWLGQVQACNQMTTIFLTAVAVKTCLCEDGWWSYESTGNIVGVQDAFKITRPWSTSYFVWTLAPQCTSNDYLRNLTPNSLPWKLHQK
jgi:hypothetical protein